LVLVRGAWHGGWCWRFVAPALGAYTPTLTVLGGLARLAREISRTP
jgi:hypothetical protein